VPGSHRVFLLPGWGQILSKVLTLAVIVTILTSMFSLPVAMGTGTTRSADGLASDNGFTNYAAAEVQARQQEELAQLKLKPHGSAALADPIQSRH
jgi:hypothetical protein